MHPAIHPLMEGVTTIEYGAHLVPELGLSGVPQHLYKDGLVVVGSPCRSNHRAATSVRRW